MTPPLRAAVLCCCAMALRADDYPRQAGIDVQHYVFRVTLSDRSDEISGDATVRVLFTGDAVSEFALDLASPARGKGMRVSAALDGGSPARFRHERGRLAIQLAPAPARGEEREFTIRYRGVPAGGLKIAKNRYGDRSFFSDNWPDLARQWLPTVDHPYDKATSEFVVTAPARYQVVANGRLLEQIDLPRGQRLTHWRESAPIAAWLNNIGVARFASRHFGTVAGIPLETWFFPRDRETAVEKFEEPTREAVEFFSARIAAFPYEKLAAVEAPNTAASMENASAIFYGERAVYGGRTNPARSASRVVWHETAHQWFGDSVTEKDWDDVWLSEGFATYLTMLAVENFEGRDAFVTGLKRSRDVIFKTEAKMPGVAVVATQPWKGIPHQIVYQKGGWALHMLRGYLGTEVFWQALREYYRRYQGGNASTADFRRTAEEVSGKPLAWFFEQWLYRAGSPVVEGGWHYNPASARIEIELSQTQAGGPYRLPLEVGVRTADGGAARVAEIEMTTRRQRFEIPSSREPSSVQLDPNTWVLMDAQFGPR